MNLFNFEEYVDEVILERGWVYLHLAQKDLQDITAYIAETLKAPKAAMDLIDALDNSIKWLQEYPYSCKLYRAIESIETEYRIMTIKNYLVFYVVTEHEVEIHRIIYAKMDGSC
ncbi:plasmid stabilization system protein ParE [Scopulibacillus darangshiensis]|uniref:Plasmid stabilization system protein ParE n=1 Tax=Scopulibacillus darangshiensis TaxID=442528 RepID=A0A4V2SMX9_9BACL|nr:type II toxin-antitoxin system RelE/ParE family toxin [Scopulibacillus darangshiensis]TCP29046.1 plasmid stabilization system protein ParE [Scopulibacillus darangshiensis]